MKLYLTILLFYLGTTQSSIYSNLKDTVQSILNRAIEDDAFNERQPTNKPNVLRFFKQYNTDKTDNVRAREKASILERARSKEHRLNHGPDIPPQSPVDPSSGKQYYHMDAVLNHVQRRANNDNDSSSEGSSSLEMNDWKDEFNALWLEKKFEAVNSTYNRGDEVNMVAARPWGVACGDPNQHDMPWGNCLMTTECDPEYRIYRGDSFCGRTLYVCCALQFATYDLYQGFDVSFADTSFSTDSEERKRRERGSKENRKRSRNKERKKREKDRRVRKRKIKKNIRRIVHEIRKILNRSFRNASHHRKKRTLILKKYIKMLKKQYRLDRKSIREVHDYDMIGVDDALMVKLNQVRDANGNFMMNNTFRDIIVNGTMDRSGARMLAAAYPELADVLQNRIRRAGGGEVEVQKNVKEKNDDYLDYDIEYGALYY